MFEATLARLDPLTFTISICVFLSRLSSPPLQLLAGFTESPPRIHVGRESWGPNSNQLTAVRIVTVTIRQRIIGRILTVIEWTWSCRDITKLEEPVQQID
jgi:hypothetical protein